MHLLVCMYVSACVYMLRCLIGGGSQRRLHLLFCSPWSPGKEDGEEDGEEEGGGGERGRKFRNVCANLGTCAQI
jgi:hypothetical protein